MKPRSQTENCRLAESFPDGLIVGENERDVEKGLGTRSKTVYLILSVMQVIAKTADFDAKPYFTTQQSCKSTCYSKAIVIHNI